MAGNVVSPTRCFRYFLCMQQFLFKKYSKLPPEMFSQKGSTTMQIIMFTEMTECSKGFKKKKKKVIKSYSKGHPNVVMTREDGAQK